MINTEQIDKLKTEMNKEFADKQKVDGILSETKELVIQDENKRWIIKDEQSYIIAVQLQKVVHALDKKIVEHHAPMKRDADKIKKTILNQEKKARENLIVSKGILAAAIGAYLKKKDEEAAEKEKIEQDRIEKERLKIAEGKIEIANDLRLTGDPDNMAEALRLEDEADDLLSQALPPVEIEKPVKIAGTRVVEYWKYKIEDETKIPREYLIPDTKKIGQIVRAMKEKTDIPGVKVWSETQNQVTGK